MNDFNIVYFNQSFTDLYGYSLEEIIGKKPGIFNADP
ncbi:MAG: PAS domain S-box protein, partial [Calditrichaeota bacterium]|nr:PAS domain S-box protein [Calditrichota bacterium]